MLHANFIAVSIIEVELLVMGFSIWGKRGCLGTQFSAAGILSTFFAPVILTLTQ